MHLNGCPHPPILLITAQESILWYFGQNFSLQKCTRIFVSEHYLVGIQPEAPNPKGEYNVPRNARVGGQVTLTIGAEPIHQISAIKLSALKRGAKNVQNWRATVQSLNKWTIDSGALLHKGHTAKGSI